MIRKFSSIFLKADEVKKGEVIKILDEGNRVEGEYQGKKNVQYLFQVEYNGDIKTLKMNDTSWRAMTEAYGEDSKDWVMKNAKIFLMPRKDDPSKKYIVLDPITDNVAEWRE